MQVNLGAKAIRCAALAVMLSLDGCTYATHRLEDFRDIFTADLGLGFGFGVDFQITDAIHSGLGGGLALQWRLGRDRLGELGTEFSRLESVYSFLVYRSASPVSAPNHQGYLWNVLYWGDYFGETPHGRDWAGRRTELPLSKNPRAPWLNLLDVDLGVMVLPVAARIGFSPGELVDFLLGVVGIDIADDDDDRDWGRSTVAEPVQPINPAFPATQQTAAADLEAMRKSLGRLRRPVFVLSGLMDAGLSKFWAADLRKLIVEEQHDMVIPVTFASHLSFDSCRTGLLELVEEHRRKLQWTGPVDVVAVSMGGLVARHAAAPPAMGAGSSRRLDIARLFTISTPHRGADMAKIPTVHPLARAMRPGSQFLERLANHYPAAGYQLLPYTLTPDFIVGAANAAPAGEAPWWLATPMLRAAHLGAMADPRFLAEIARHLRGETARATTPRVPVPK